ncbi:MAG TPA: alcohol dehydrogenase catalytic domain-containing protein [Micromonosporaceae bacterium]|nr:alcohol dehydrogenase catalytic domain-containing protein [Micromonosporaceae bacterium]
MRGYVVRGPHAYGLADLPDPVPGPGELLVAPAAVGICGSDLELRDGRRPAEYVRYPVVPGHEWSGHVVATGPGVKGIDPGTPVVVEGVRACGRCARCAEGRNNLCAAEYAETGFTEPGALAERLVVPAHLAHPLAIGRSITAAALIEPAACVATGLLEVGVPRAGSRVAVVGDGPLGLLAVGLLALTSPRELLLVGSRTQRTGYATRLGATATLHRDDIAEARGEFDTVVECTNSAAGAVGALSLARRAGTVVLLGISGTGAPAVDPDVISLGHLRVQGVFAASRAAWQWLVELYGAGLFDPSTLVTHRFPLERADEAFAVLADRDAGAIKVVVEPNGEAR